MKSREKTQENKRSWVKPTNGKEIINKECLDQLVSIGDNLPPATRRPLVDLLKKYKHVFAWTPTNMEGVDREVIEHKLMIKLGEKEVK